MSREQMGVTFYQKHCLNFMATLYWITMLFY